MSEAAPERRTTPPPPRSSEGGDVFSKKYGPLPGWGWTLLAAGAGVAYILYRKYKSAQAAATTASAQTYTPSGIDYGPQLATIQEEIQNLQGAESKEKDGKDKDADKDKDGKPTDGKGDDGKKPPARKPPARRPPPKKKPGDR